jgi:hypothetical protein
LYPTKGGYNLAASGLTSFSKDGETLVIIGTTAKQRQSLRQLLPHPLDSPRHCFVAVLDSVGFAMGKFG